MAIRTVDWGLGLGNVPEPATTPATDRVVALVSDRESTATEERLDRACRVYDCLVRSWGNKFPTPALPADSDAAEALPLAVGGHSGPTDDPPRPLGWAATASPATRPDAPRGPDFFLQFLSN